MSDPRHNDDDRNVTNSLIDLSDYCKYSESRKVEKVALNDWAEAVVGWKAVEAALKPPAPVNTTTKKKRVIERSVSDLHYGSTYGNQGDDFWSNSSGNSGFKQAVRCVGDDFQTYPIPPWKSNIEQGTYRYIQDNGSYRTLKFMDDDRKEWFTVRKKLPEKVSTTWHQNCKRMQKEIRRQLRKDLQGDSEKNALARKLGNTSRTSSEHTSGDDTARSMSEAARTQNEMTDSGNVETTETLGVSHSQGIHGRPLYRNDVRIKSTQSDGALNNVKKMKTIHESEPPTPMPPQHSIPSNNQLFKSASDLFIENFSSRIKNLEDEIKQDSKWSRKNDTDSSKTSNKPKHKERQSGFKENFGASTTPRLVLKTETLTSDIFSVKSVPQKELRPLEKTRAFGRPSIGSGGSSQASNTPGVTPTPYQTASSTSNGVSKTPTESANNGTLKPPHENGKPSMFNTLTGTKINTNPNKRLSKGFTAPATITICDNNQSSGPGAANFVEAFRPVVLDKKLEAKTPIQNMPAILPEIAGKRLEVMNISHRYL